jgi:type II secretion system protein G
MRLFLFYCITIVCVAGCRRPNPIAVIDDPKSPHGVEAAAFEGKTYKSVDGERALTLISREECEYRNGSTTLLAKYTEQSDALRVVMNTFGAQEVIYFRITPDGLRSNQGLELLTPTGYERRQVQMRQDEAAAKIGRTQNDISTLALAITSYEVLGRTLPSTAQGLRALVERPLSEPRPSAWVQQLSALPTYPLSHDYYYVRPGKHNPAAFDLYSAGPDLQPGTVDDIGNWQQ